LNLDKPLVSVLIPTYNRPFYFEISLKSVLAQTFKNYEIVIGDDSTNDETESMIQPYLKNYPFIRYYKNKENIGQFENDLQLLRLAEGKFINFLMDDDMFHPNKLEKMVPYLLKDENVKIVTSHRAGIDAQSNLQPLVDITMKITQVDALFDKQMMAKMVFSNNFNFVNFNFIGEPTTAMFRKDDLVEPFGTFDGRRYGSNVDLATWFSLMNGGHGVYLADTLSFFRMHDGQQIRQFETHIKNVTDHAHSILVAPKYHFIDVESIEYQIAIHRSLNQITNDIFSKRDFIITNYKERVASYIRELSEFADRLLTLQRSNFDQNFLYLKSHI